MIAGLVLVLISSLPGLLQASPPPRYLVKSTCNNFTCGKFTIPYPFGMGEACYANISYSINCNHSKPFLNHTGLNLEVLNISLDHQTVTVNSPISSLCNHTKGTETKASIDLNGSPFVFSSLDNIFMVLGCGSARLMNQSKAVMAGCGSTCPSVQVDAKECYGVHCCQTTISSRTTSLYRRHLLRKYSVNITTEEKETDCVRHALVDEDWFSRHFSSQAVIEMGYAPLVLMWSIVRNDRFGSNRCDSFPFDGYGTEYPCTCGWNEEGNPYLKNGCQGTLLS